MSDRATNGKRKLKAFIFSRSKLKSIITVFCAEA